LGEKRTALKYFEQALPLWRASGNQRDEAVTLNNIGLTYDSLGEKQEALKYYEQALPLRRALGDQRGEAVTLNNIGLVYQSLDEWQKALDYLQQALPLRRAVGDRSGEAVTLNNIGLIYYSVGELQKALDDFQQALPLRRAVGNQRGEATTLSNIGAVYEALGEYQKALDYLQQVLPLRRAVGDRSGEATTLNTLGLVYKQLGEYQRALEYYDQALPLWRAVGDRSGEATTLSNIGAVYEVMGEYERALEYHERALPLRRAVGNRSGEAATLNNLAVVYERLGDKQKALQHHERALPLRRAVGDRRGEAFTLTNLGVVYAALGEKEKALEHHEQALVLWRAVGDQNGEARTLTNIARAERDRGHLAEARSRLETALAITESLRATVVSQALRRSYLASKQSQDELYIDLLMRLHQSQPAAGHDALALHASERARARSLLDVLGEARADIRQGVEPSLLERERSLQQQLTAKAERLTQVLSGKHTDEQAAAAQKELDGLLTQYQEVQGQIRANSPRYAALTQPQPLSLREIQQSLDEQTLLLEYALGEERSFLWAVTPTSLNSFELPQRADLETTATRVYNQLTARRQRIKFEEPAERLARWAQADAEYAEAATTLSQMLLGPVAEQLGRKRLVIVSDGALQYIPFAALPAPRPSSVVSGPLSEEEKNNGQRTTDNGQRPLVVEHEIISLPSASALAVLRRELSNRMPAAKTVAVLADPVFQPDDPRVRLNRAKRQPQSDETETEPAGLRRRRDEVERTARESGIVRFQRLPFTRQEAGAIIAFAPHGQRLTALNFEASRATVQNTDLGQFRIVHFATHGSLNTVHPELSGIVLSLVDERGEPQDGLIRLWEVYNLRLGADVVVLSGCQTALGQEIRGEGLIGLTRGFMYAGAARVVASLWSVEDQATAELMKRFYREMLQNEQRPAAALRAAQLSMWKDSRWRAPFYWAAFVLQGEWK
jgi:CHAT domain-containing protein/Tfp pilus assembly protein PilF